MTETKRPSLKARVGAGAALLDEKRPGWFREVDPKLLDMGDGCLCVLGQLYRPKRKTWRDGFFLGLRALKINVTPTGRRQDLDADLGFNLYDDEGYERYYSLEGGWKREIRARLKASA